MNKNHDLSIVILNHNTEVLLSNCLKSLSKLQSELDFETIVVDNGSTDDSISSLVKNFPWVRLIKLETNLGFAAGNNKAKSQCSAKHVLFLNSDTEVPAGTLKMAFEFMEQNLKVGVVTCKMVLPNGNLDKDSKRSFPTPWVSFTHFSGLDKLFPSSNLFAKYWYGYRPNDETFDIDVAQGAFFFVRKIALDKVGWFDESYFLDGEDIDLSWRIKEAGYRIVYYPKISILHIKGATKGKNLGHNKALTPAQRRRFILAGVDSMEIFYKKHLKAKYPFIVYIFVILGVNLLKIIRLIKI